MSVQEKRQHIGRETVEQDNIYKGTIRYIEQIATDLGLDHRFVGGILPDLLNDDTWVEVRENHRVYLHNHNPLTLRRPDGSRKDLDLICFTDDPEKVRAFKKILGKHKDPDSKLYPPISIEPTHHYPGWPQRKSPTQFVSTINRTETDGGKQLSLDFGSIHQPITEESMNQWKIALEDGTEFTILHPFAHLLRYFMRVPSGRKKKDNSDKFRRLLTLSDQVLEATPKDKIHFGPLYEPWVDFIDKLLHDPHLDMQIKRTMMRIYWNTAGEMISHGKGPFTLLQRLSNSFTG